MKKIIISGFLALFAFANVSAQNQSYKVYDLDGNEYENNKTYGYNIHGTLGDPIEEAHLDLVFENAGSEDIRLYGQVVSFTNTNGANAQFCIIDACYFPLEEGGLYPGAGGMLAPGEILGNPGGFPNYFINLDGNSPVEYKIRFFQGDVDTGEEIPNTTFNMTYLYDEDYMNVSDMQSVAIAEVYPTVAKGFTNVNLKENAQVQILNAEGRTVKSFSLKSGQSQLNLSGLSAGVYWVTFKGDSGKATHTRIVVK
ncbi:MAG: T9SS type A sorting domain-containing protein [Weeksellaceae bacterium]